ncbi:glycoside hydrolase family 43 protein [Sphingobacterium rhinopitheci]|uniref:glycoside hydrolase family 43 protein n=1 Tax=Sphingobacterium rhinopitheci TaxID=2781960 RepID=UPI001F52083D|nr:glycoside hydrolase family 43 protein [Sphingobacterium rhinopitheci]MCI0921463.1 glycoside hydrolase family 43 protein [Sphingobacterium rhinopitheci]
MKKIFHLFILFTISLSSYAQDSVYMFSYFINNGADGLHLAYSNDGLEWKEIQDGKSYLQPKLSPDKLMRDPCIIRGGDGKFHMVWTVSWTQRSIGYAHSTDLINWSEQQLIPVMEHEPLARNTWAPEITYDPSDKTYLIYWSTTITGLFPETQEEKENAYNHRIYYTKTKDFKTFEKTKILLEPGFNVIDASIVPIDGQWKMFIKDETIVPPKKDIKIVSAKNIEGPYTNISDAITGDYWAEGPTTLKVGDEWIVYFDKYTEHKYGAVKSKDLKKWTDISDQIKMPSQLRHGTAFKISQAEFKKLL